MASERIHRQACAAYTALCSYSKWIGILLIGIVILGSLTPALAQSSTVTVELTATLRLRSGPGTQYSTMATMEYPSQLPVLAKNPDQTWLKVNYHGIVGWAASEYLRVISGSLSGVPIETGTSAPSSIVASLSDPYISFVADRMSINSGECATLSWNVEHINQVYYEGQGVVGNGSNTECPTAATTYTLRVLLLDGSWVERSVVISVIAPQPRPQSRLDYTLDPNYGWKNLTAGFWPDPDVTYISSGGDVDVSYLGGDCVGYATPNPDLTLYYDGYSDMLRIYFVAYDAGADATLIVNTPDGNWYCEDDSFDTLNPSLMWRSALSGEYNIWVGSLDNSGSDSGALYITEIADNHP